MQSYLVRAIRIVAVVGVAGLLAFSTGCKSSKVAKAQSPPPSSISTPVRVEQPAAQPQPAAVTVVPAEEYAFIKNRRAPASKPLPSVTPPAPEPAPLASPAPQGPQYYIMKKGDTLYAIARKYNIPPKRLIAANNFPNPNVLPVGTRVKLP